MTAPNFHTTASSGAGGVAEAGLGKWTHRSDDSRRAARVSYRLAQVPTVLEQTVIDQMRAAGDAQGVAVPRSFMVDYYISLKTNPFVVLSGGAPELQSAFSRGVAEALVGVGNSQFLQIASGASWPQGTGEGGYYRSLLERFDSLRLLDFLHEAALEGNVGKLFFLCLDGLHPDEVNHFFETLVRLTPEGEKRLALPDLPPDQQPVLPANLYITANLQVAPEAYQLSQHVLRNAGIFDLSTVATLGHRQRTGIMPVPPVGYQRILLAAAMHDVDAARFKLASILGDLFTSQLRPSPVLAQMLWRGGAALGSRTLRELTCYVANSFDKQGRGLFDGANPQHNAQIALDIHAAQRVVWQLPSEQGAYLRHELHAYRSELFAELG